MPDRGRGIGLLLDCVAGEMAREGCGGEIFTSSRAVLAGSPRVAATGTQKPGSVFMYSYR